MISKSEHHPWREKDSVRPRMVLSSRLFQFIYVVLMAARVVGPSNSLAAEFDMHQPADTSSPRATLKSFLVACNEAYALIKKERYFDRNSPEHRPLTMRILDCMNVRNVPEFERFDFACEAAVCLKEILDRVDLPPFEDIPGAENVGEDGKVQEITKWQVPGTRITIARIEDGPQRHEYLFTSGTVDRAVSHYHDVKSMPYRTTGIETSDGFYDWYVSAPGDRYVAVIVDRLPDWTRERIWELAIWKWIGLVLGVVVTMALMGTVYKVQGTLVRRFRDQALWLYGLTILIPIVGVLIPLGFREFSYNQLSLRGTWLYVVSFIAHMTALIASLIVVFGIGNRVATIIIASPRINPQSLDAQFIRIVSRLLSLVAAVVIFLEGGRYLGIPVTTLLASAGVGGLAVALAAQDSLKNLFGTIMLLLDKPFRAGERIVFGRYDGLVEDIGLRSTKIRLLTGHLATIPNDELARTDIENIGRRPYIQRKATIEMPSDTPVAKVKRALQIVRSALKDHEGMKEDFPPRVFLSDLNKSSIGILIIYWYHPPDYYEFLAFSERINLKIMENFESQGIPFAAPALTLHMPNGRKALDS